jgi:BirA family biotin operon repressor/biotin-[acetyl-CoA-carboxylase] ligase
MNKIRQQLIQYLLAHNQYVSGEELSHKLNISRTAVWKHIEELRREGYNIKAVRKQGYLLVEEPKDLSPSVISSHVTTNWLGKNVYVYEKVSSTQEVAQRLAREGAPSGTVIVADEQEAGKGRLGRSWYSPPGTGLWLSFILRPNMPLHAVSQLTLLTAVAVLQAVKQVVNLPLSIKWPNDLLIRGKKVAGILMELKAEADQVHFVVVGIGINVNQSQEDFPDPIKEKATSLAIENQAVVSRKNVIIQLLNVWEALYETYQRQGFGPIKSLWEKEADSLGKLITARTASGQVTGIAKGISDDGALLLQDGQGKILKIYSADIEI